MGFLEFILVITVTNIAFNYLDKKYQLVAKYEDKNNRWFKRIMNISSVVSLLLSSSAQTVLKKIIDSGLIVGLFQAVTAIPFFMQSYISVTINQRQNLEKENEKKMDVDLTYCYYCGGELDGSDICPSCGTKLEL